MAPDAQSLVGKAVAGGRYEIVKLLGEGAMGAVYQARQAAMDRMVALKLIRPDLVQTDDTAARFVKEMKLTAKVEHPNTIRVYDFGDWDGRLFLAMELVAGWPLGALVAAGRLELRRIVRIAKQVANALGAAHERGIVHRDLKPDNVMLLESYGEPDFVKVLDFGIAKSLEEKTDLTIAGSLVGTPAYMSPEQALGRPVDARTDLYSLGVMLYQMACGRVPFDAPTVGSMLMAHATEPPPPVLQVAPETDPELARLIMQLLAKEPGARPQSAAEVVARLDACLAPSPARRRGRAALVVAGVAIVVGLGVAAVGLLGGGEAGCRPGGAAAFALRARVELDDDAERALASADEAVAGCPAFPVAHDVRGNALAKLGRLDEAEDAYVRALALAPGYDAPRFNLGLVQLRRKDAGAVATFTELLRRRPDHPDAHLARAHAELLAGRADDALADLDEAVRRAPKRAEAWALLGQVRERLQRGDWQAAYCQAKALGHAGAAARCPDGP